MLVEKIEPGAKDIVFVYTTCPDVEEARAIALSAIKEKLAICADYWVIGSIYPWQGVLEEVSQYMLMLTTEKELSDPLMKHISAVHSYTTPMITRLDTAVMNNSYAFWADNTLKDKIEYISEQEKLAQEKNDEEDGYHPGKLK